MPNVSFAGGKKGEAVATAPESAADSATSKAIVPAEDRTLATPLPQSAGFQGAWDREDVRLPRVNLVHKTSDMELINKFGIGGFAFNKEVKLSDGKTPIFVTALRAAKDYVQKLPYGDPTNPAVFKTVEEVIANGGSLNYADVKSGKFFQPRAHIQLAVPMPEGTDAEGEALFPYEFEDAIYGMAILTVSSSAYTSVGKELATLCTNNKVMRKGMHFGRLSLTSEVKQNAANSWHIPVIKYAGENPAELVAFFEGLL